MRAVLDTNVWLSATFWQGNPYRIVNLAEDGKIEIIVTREIIEEIAEILNRESKFQKFISDRKTAISALIKAILSISVFVETMVKIDAMKADPDDNKILEAAIGGKADFIVSGDIHLLELESFRGIKIVTPRQFLESLG